MTSGQPILHMLRASIILAIAAVPEGLLIAATVILVLDMCKVLKRNDLVRHMLAAVQVSKAFASQFKPGGWVMFMRMRLRLMASLHQIAERGLELLKDEDTAVRARLQEAHDMFSLIEQELPALLERVEAKRGTR